MPICLDTSAPNPAATNSLSPLKFLRSWDFAIWLAAAPATPVAFAAHRRLVDIHPFNDGNGRTARLLMNLILIRGGYPAIAVRPEDRLAYILALQQSQAEAEANRSTACSTRL